MLQTPKQYDTVEKALEAATWLGLTNVVIISEMEDGSMVFIQSEMADASSNWLLDRAKGIIMNPELHRQ